LGVITNYLITIYCYSNLYEGVDETDTSCRNTTSTTGIWIIGGMMIFMVCCLAAWAVLSNRNVELETEGVLNNPQYRPRGDFELKMDSFKWNDNKTSNS
tara:strand:- start:995 stop:1291 length:297 start_codon:yes stop_codon:yes gene_type:complete